MYVITPDPLLQNGEAYVEVELQINKAGLFGEVVCTGPLPPAWLADESIIRKLGPTHLTKNKAVRFIKWGDAMVYLSGTQIVHAAVPGDQCGRKRFRREKTQRGTIGQ